MKNTFFIIFTTSIILFACINSSIISESCSQGISLWYNSVIPVLLPFMLLTGVIMNSIDLSRVSSRSACIIAIITGLFCGFPSGTIIVSYLYQNKLLTKRTSQILLPLCNNVSPMFLYGYIYSGYLYKYITLFQLITSIYFPQIICTVIYFLFAHMHTNYHSKTHFSKTIFDEPSDTISDECAAASDHKNQFNYSDIISSSIHNITTIGVLMVIFSIISNLITSFFSYKNAYIVTSFFEISSGINTIGLLNVSEKTKTALILSLTAFGGLSALFQSYESIQKSGLSFLKYISIKCLYGIICAMTTIIKF